MNWNKTWMWRKSVALVVDFYWTRRRRVGTISPCKIQYFSMPFSSIVFWNSAPEKNCQHLTNWTRRSSADVTADEMVDKSKSVLPRLERNSFFMHITIRVAWENSRHLATLSLVSPPNDVWETSAEIPYWWRVTTQIWVVLLIGWIKFPTWHDQSEALPISG